MPVCEFPCVCLLGYVCRSVSCGLASQRRRAQVSRQMCMRTPAFSISPWPSPSTRGGTRLGSEAWSLPVSPGGPERSCFPSRLAGGPVLGEAPGLGGRGGGVMCGGTPLAFTVPFGGWQCPLKPTGKLISRPEDVQSACGCWRREGGGVGEAESARRPPCKPRSYKMHFPTYPSGLSEPLLLTALFIHDRQLINIQTS